MSGFPHSKVTKLLHIPGSSEQLSVSVWSLWRILSIFVSVTICEVYSKTVAIWWILINGTFIWWWWWCTNQGPLTVLSTSVIKDFLQETNYFFYFFHENIHFSPSLANCLGYYVDASFLVFKECDITLWVPDAWNRFLIRVWHTKEKTCLL